ncbi:putative aminotransferase [Rhodococcus rhodnii LMG 5362]|uniref:Putative aminotransferase n=1 Tax=Rhodococcus rhodnii LMG 5362 TaxID=1273125 RepID=R7WSK1_9NOCA|nr:putative aminotransferase [Rhodococcus rhodnii LMG 5362]
MADSLRREYGGRPPETRLPSTRAIAAQHGVGPVTVQSALRLLVAEGIVETRPGNGTFVARRPRPPHERDLSWQTTALGPAGPLDVELPGARSAAPGALAMHGGYPAPELLPGALVRSALARAARDSSVVLDAQMNSGLPRLRAWFANEPGPAAGYDADDVLVTNGGQSAVSATLRALAAPGDAVVMESPTYWGAMLAARAHGLRIVPIARTVDGIDPGDLADALAAHNARVFYAQPTFANPSGEVWSPSVRAETLRVLAEHKAFVVEDDWARDLAIDDAPPPLAAADPDGHVVYVRSLTKSMSPSIRVAGIVARGPALRRISTSRWAGEMFVPGLAQHVALDVLTAPGWRRHIATLRRELRERRDALVRELRATPLSVDRVPGGGMSVWVRLPGDVPARDVARRASALGLEVAPGDDWFPAEPPGQCVRMGFVATLPTRYREAVGILAEAAGV